MKFIRSVKQCEGPGGTLEIWELHNGLFLGCWKDEVYYHMFINDKIDNAYTQYIFNLLNHPYNGIQMELGSFMPLKIKMEHKYFEKFVQLVEKLNIEDLKTDPFSG